MHVPSSFFKWGLVFLIVIALAGVACDDGDPIVIPPTSGEIGPEGGEVVAGDASIVIPPGALEESTVFSMAHANGTTTIEGYVLVGPLIEIIPTGTVFALPATVTVPYDRNDIPEGAEEDQVVLFTADDINGEFTQLVTSVVSSTRCASTSRESSE